MGGAMHKIAKIVIVFFFSIGTTTGLFSQLNLKIGYNPTLGSFSGINEVLRDYNPDGFNVERAFGSLRFVHGIQLGVRYKISHSAFELSWENISRDRTALSYSPVNDSFLERKYNFGINTWALSFDNYFNPIGFGTMITSSKLNVTRDIGNNNLSVSNQRNWGLRAQLNWSIQESELVALVIKPYYQFYFKDYSLNGLSTDLNDKLPERNESLSYFGISFVFYNGRQ